MRFTKFILLAACAGVMFNMTACQKDEVSEESNNQTTQIVPEKEVLLSGFAKTLSMATYERQDVREFLKTEAIKQFDKNYDVLYALIRDKKINGTTFHDILAEYSSEEEISMIESNVPLLNILVPKIAFFNIEAENMDCEDAEIPVVVVKDSVNSFYLNGNCEMDIAKGEVPDFHTFVVNENSRVIVNMTKSGAPSVSFISPNYDGSRHTALTRSEVVPSNEVDAKAIAAYNYFYKDDASANSRAYQRDYIYYGITPSNGNGNLNRNVSEYISFIEINPNSYTNIADQKANETFDDPRISNSTVTRKKKEYTEEELIDRMWTQGSFNFRIEIISANSSQPVIVYIPLRPEEIWNFNISCKYEHGTWFKKKKYTYTIDPAKFTAKRVYLTPEEISFGKWDLSEEALYRYVNIFEDDKSAKYSKTETYEMTKMTSSKVNGSIKFGLGTNSVTIGSDMSGSTTRTESKSFSVERQEEDDHLGTAKIYFYDAIIDGKSGNDYLVHTYNTGSVKFGLAVK